MIPFDLISELTMATPSKIILFVLDGLGGFPNPETRRTELATARRPNLDQIARDSITGLTIPVAPGITSGSGPGHLALFGYDPVRDLVGRGVLSALGIGFPLGPNDLAARINFATLGEDGNIVDRRAGRISTEKNRELIALLRQKVRVPGVEIFLESEAAHRAMGVFRAEGLSPELNDADPQHVGVPPIPIVAQDPAAERSAAVVNQFLSQASEVLKAAHPANYILVRGFAKAPHLPQFSSLYKLRAAAIATYPMYRGLARLVGMDVLPTGDTIVDEIATMRENWDKYDFFFLHFKYTDTTGEDGNFEAKVRAIEDVDQAIPSITALKPDVLAVCGDHSTPSRLQGHSWHPVPFMLHSPWEIPDTVTEFTEQACQCGTLGRFPAQQVMLMLLANALKLEKYGA